MKNLITGWFILLTFLFVLALIVTALFGVVSLIVPELGADLRFIVALLVFMLLVPLSSLAHAIGKEYNNP